MTEKHYKTFHFAHCIGVFEGGGVCGAALAGAYQAAHDHGVTFGRVAGASAGSIVAAMVAAGASPEFVVREMLDKDFTSFLKPAKQEQAPFVKSSTALNVLKSITF